MARKRTYRNIMAHFISHYPNKEISLQVGLAFARSHMKYLEIQFPFSDPSADGPVIQTACEKAIAKGAFSCEGGFGLIKELREKCKEENITVPLIFLMCYASIIIVSDISSFLKNAKNAGVYGIIIPDIPFDSEDGLFIQKECRRQGIEYVPVSVVTSPKKRILQLLKICDPEYVYVALRAGTTGNKTDIVDGIANFLSSTTFDFVKVLGGFGLKTAEHVRALTLHAHAAVIGTVFVECITETIKNSKKTSQKELICTVSTAIEKTCKKLLL